MHRDLLSPAPRCNVLRAHESSSTALAGKSQQIIGHNRDRPAGTFLPRRVGRRIHHDLTNDSPAVVVGVAARDKKTSKRFGDLLGSRLGCVPIEVMQRGAHAAPAVDRLRKRNRTLPALLC